MMPVRHHRLPVVQLPPCGLVRNPLFFDKHISEGRIAMTPSAAGWRSSAAYEHVDEMSASDLAWEWLRRNDDYDEDFQELGDAGTDTKALTDKIRRRWGLRFPHRPVGTSV